MTNQMKKNIEETNPLDMARDLLNFEFYNKNLAEDIFKEIDDAENKDQTVKQFMVPALTGICDSFCRKMKITTPVSQIVTECLEFDEKKYVGTIVYMSDHEFEKQREYNREKMDNPYKRKKYKENKEGNKLIEDEYTDGSKIYRNTKDAKNRNFKNPTEKTSDVDHIIPLKEIHLRTEKNPMLSQQDVKEIGNIVDNYAITNSKDNRSKGDKTNTEFVKENENISDSQKKIMLEKEKMAESKVAQVQNSKIINNVKNKEMRDKTLKNLNKESFDNAKTAVGDEILSRVTIVLIKTTYFEISDILKNGVLNNFETNNKLYALKLRAQRAIKYIMSSIKDFISDGIGSFLTNFVKCFIKMIFDLFAGMIKRIGDIIIKGFHAIIQAVKLLINPPEGMTLRQRMDAITKIIATTAVGGLIFAAREFIEKMLPTGIFGDILFMLIEGFSVAGIVYLLDKIDLFGSKWEMKQMRIKEIFEERIGEVEKNSLEFEKISLQRLAEQKEEFMSMTKKMKLCLDTQEFEMANEMALNISKFFGVKLEYSNRDEFVEMIEKTGLMVF